MIPLPAAIIMWRSGVSAAGSWVKFPEGASASISSPGRNSRVSQVDMTPSGTRFTPILSAPSGAREQSE